MLIRIIFAIPKKVNCYLLILCFSNDKPRGEESLICLSPPISFPFPTSRCALPFFVNDAVFVDDLISRYFESEGDDVILAVCNPNEKGLRMELAANVSSVSCFVSLNED